MTGTQLLEGSSGTQFAGRIHLARHGKPDLPARGWLSRAQFNAWWSEYGRVGLVASDQAPEILQGIAARAAAIVASPAPRAHETARALAANRDIVIDVIYAEAPLPAPWILPYIQMSPVIWGITARFTWWLGYAGGGESRYEAELRAREAADRLIELAADGDGDVLLCGHGWFNHMMARELKRRGWIKIKGGGERLWGHNTFASPV